MRPILDAIVALHDNLDAAGIPHAFGGAFALLWCTGEPRTTVDIDLNIFVAPDRALTMSSLHCQRRSFLPVKK